MEEMNKEVELEVQQETQEETLKEKEDTQENKEDENVEIEIENEEENKIKELEEQISSLKNAYAKAYADTENIKKRLNNEFEQLKKYRAQSFALDILPVIDNLERALKQETSDEEFKKGVEMIYNQLMSALEKEGVSKMEPLGKEFDANYHQAIMAEKKEDEKSGIVLEVFQQGYMLKDRILRAAMVKVSE